LWVPAGACASIRRAKKIRKERQDDSRPQALGLTAVAALAMSAMFASAAQAVNGVFHLV